MSHCIMLHLAWAQYHRFLVNIFGPELGQESDRLTRSLFFCYIFLNDRFGDPTEKKYVYICWTGGSCFRKWGYKNFQDAGFGQG